MKIFIFQQTIYTFLEAHVYKHTCVSMFSLGTNNAIMFRFFFYDRMRLLTFKFR